MYLIRVKRKVGSTPTKVGIGNPKVQMDVEQLLRFYVEKYFGENAL
jgi:hypothetical protein